MEGEQEGEILRKEFPSTMHRVKKRSCKQIWPETRIDLSPFPAGRGKSRKEEEMVSGGGRLPVSSRRARRSVFRVTDTMKSGSETGDTALLERQRVDNRLHRLSPCCHFEIDLIPFCLALPIPAGSSP